MVKNVNFIIYSNLCKHTRVRKHVPEHVVVVMTASDNATFPDLPKYRVQVTNS